MTRLMSLIDHNDFTIFNVLKVNVIENVKATMSRCKIRDEFIRRGLYVLIYVNVK